MPTKTLGLHILAEYYNCEAAVLDKIEIIKEAMNEAAKIANATIVETVIHQFSPHGVSGVVVIAESHISIHTWPEHNYVAIDIFTCGETLETQKAIDYLNGIFKAQSIVVKQINRGVIAIH